MHSVNTQKIVNYHRVVIHNTNILVDHDSNLNRCYTATLTYCVYPEFEIKSLRLCLT